MPPATGAAAASPALNPLQRLKGGEDPDALARELVAAMKERRSPVALAASLARDRDPDVAALGARALAGSGLPEALQALTKVMAEIADADQRQLLADEASAEFDRALATPLVDLVVRADDDTVLAMAQQAVARLADRELLGMLRDRTAGATDGRSANRLADAVRLIENDALTPELTVMAGLAAVDPRTVALRRAALEALGSIGSARAAEFLLTGLAAAPEESREGYVRAVARIRNEGGLACLVRAAATAAAGAPGQAAVQAAALQALGNYDHPDLAALASNAAANATDPAVRSAADASLKRIQENMAAESHAAEDAP